MWCSGPLRRFECIPWGAVFMSNVKHINTAPHLTQPNRAPMKFFESTFAEYLAAFDARNLHPSLRPLIDQMAEGMFQNTIVYGPPGAGKYTQSLHFVRQCSCPDGLAVEKRVSVEPGKHACVIRASAVHYEVDMSALGCNSRSVWHAAFTQIMDIIRTKRGGFGIIVCTEFQSVHPELLDVFYSYMQDNHFLIDVERARVGFVLVTSQLDFVPARIVHCCQTLRIPKPDAGDCLRCGMASATPAVLRQTTNLKHLRVSASGAQIDRLNAPHEDVCGQIVAAILAVRDQPPTAPQNFLGFREMLYKILAYGMDAHACVWRIIRGLVAAEYIRPGHMSGLRTYMFRTFLPQYAGNYRPIYHLEAFVVYLLSLASDNEPQYPQPQQPQQPQHGRSVSGPGDSPRGEEEHEAHQEPVLPPGATAPPGQDGWIETVGGDI